MKNIVDISILTLVRSMVFLLEVLPEAMGKALCRAWIGLFFLIIPRFPKTARRNLSLVFPEKSEKERELIYRKSRLVLADNFYSFSQIPFLTPKKAKDLCEYDHNLKVLNKTQEISNGVGTLIVTMHFDAFEIFIHIHSMNYRPASVMGRVTGMKRFDAWWNGRREIFGNKLFSRKGGYKEVVKRLKAGEDVVIMSDQNIKKNHAVFVDFFGIKAAATKTVALAALRTGAPVVYGAATKTPDNKYFLEFDHLPHPSTMGETTDEKVQNFTQLLHNSFEKQIRAKPEAWFWLHRRWKTRPEGEPENIY